jgi:hypothetical protein
MYAELIFVTITQRYSESHQEGEIGNLYSRPTVHDDGIKVVLIVP